MTKDSAQHNESDEQSTRNIHSTRNERSIYNAYNKYYKYGERILNCIRNIPTPDEKAESEARARLDKLTKPLGSLGRLEDLVADIAGMTGNAKPSIDNKAIVIMCADNGVVDEGVTQVGSEVTASVTENFTKGLTCVNVFSELVGARIVIVDIGVKADLRSDGILNMKVRHGASNIAKGPAMSLDEVVLCIETGISVVEGLWREGVNVIGTGEMGIGNTTTSSAVTSALLGKDPLLMVGRGAGLSDVGLIRKREIVKRALDVNKPDADDPIDVVMKVGGFDIAGLIGCYLGASLHRIPVLVDGFISAAAALAATKICPAARAYMIPSHSSVEPGVSYVIEALAMKPYLELGMRLGEGTGAALGFFLLDAAMAAYTKMGTFGDATNIEQYVPL